MHDIIAKGKGAPVYINILDVVNISKAFTQTFSFSNMTMAKPEKYSLKRGLKVYGENGHAAVQSEFSQVHNRGIFELQDHKQLAYEKIKNCLESHMFLEVK